MLPEKSIFVPFCIVLKFKIGNHNNLFHHLNRIAKLAQFLFSRHQAVAFLLCYLFYFYKFFLGISLQSRVLITLFTLLLLILLSIVCISQFITCFYFVMNSVTESIGQSIVFLEKAIYDILEFQQEIYSLKEGSCTVTEFCS